ncbi:MAG: chorismate synthase [Actinomycetaceae bacterium]|nr:chorismate synthase [Actinomycetaceae bacterium]
MLRWLSAGESHGEQLLGILDGVPAGVYLQTKDIAFHLARRRHGAGRGARQKFEQDDIRVVGGLRHGVTTGAPIGIVIGNTEWPKWETVMSSDPVPPHALESDAGQGDHKEIARQKPLRCPRPGHADLVGMLAYNLDDARPVLERASARETAMRVALGAVAQAIAEQCAGIQFVSHVTNIGGVALPDDAPRPRPEQRDELDRSPVRCLDTETAKQMEQRLHTVKKQADTLGGEVEVLAYNMPIGLGTHTQHDRRLDARLASEIMSIQAVKAVGIGDGHALGNICGSAAHDEIIDTFAYADMFACTPHSDQVIANSKWVRFTNHAGGVEGGMSNGHPLRVSATMKPISTVPHSLRTLDMDTSQPAQALHQRSDVCAVVPLAVIVEAMTALVVTDALLEQFGNKSIDHIRTNIAAYQQHIQERLQ